MSKSKIFVFGASGHAKVVIDIIEKQKCHEIVFLIDDDATLKGSNVYGYHVLGGKQELLNSKVKLGIVAIGNNKARLTVSSWLSDNGFNMITAIHPSASIARGVVIGSNSVIMAGAVVNSDCSIGNNVIINTKASIDHDCFIGNGVHIAPGAILCGTVFVGDGSFICAGATIIPNLQIGAGVIVGAGSTVIGDIQDNTTVVGSPARIIS